MTAFWTAIRGAPVRTSRLSSTTGVPGAAPASVPVKLDARPPRRVSVVLRVLANRVTSSAA